MQKSKLWWLSGLLFFVIASGLTALGAVLKHQPSFYRVGAVADEGTRRELATICLSRFSQMMIDLKHRQENWGSEVTESQLNCFFEESFAQLGEAESISKLGISGINVTLDEEQHCRLAFRYGAGWFSTVVSFDLKVWLVPKEPNVIAVQVLRARAGGLPISSQSVLKKLSDHAQQQNYKVTLYRHESCPVAVIELQPYQPHPDSVLTSLSIKDGRLTIQGRTVEHALAPPPPKLSTPMPR